LPLSFSVRCDRQDSCLQVEVTELLKLANKVRGGNMWLVIRAGRKLNGHEVSGHALVLDEFRNLVLKHFPVVFVDVLRDVQREQDHSFRLVLLYIRKRTFPYFFLIFFGHIRLSYYRPSGRLRKVKQLTSAVRIVLVQGRAHRITFVPPTS